MAVLFVSLATFKTYLPVKTGVTSYDSILTAIMEATAEQIEAWCDRKFDKVIGTVEYHHSRDRRYETYDLFGSSSTGTRRVVEEQILHLKRYPIDTSASFRIWWDPRREFDSDTEITDSDAVWKDAETGRVFVRWPTVAGRHYFKVEYTGGYATAGSPPDMEATLPEAIKHAFIVQAVHNWTRSRAQNIGVLADRTDNRDPRIDAYTRYSVLGGLVPEVQHLLAPYRRPRSTAL